MFSILSTSCLALLLVWRPHGPASDFPSLKGARSRRFPDTPAGRNFHSLASYSFKQRRTAPNWMPTSISMIPARPVDNEKAVPLGMDRRF